MEQTLHSLADELSPLFERLVPSAYANHVAHEKENGDLDSCRLGFGPNLRPFSSATVVSDFCAHNHKDMSNMSGGCTVVSG